MCFPWALARLLPAAFGADSITERRLQRARVRTVADAFMENHLVGAGLSLIKGSISVGRTAFNMS
jgi:hypothetical protein